MHRPRQLDKSGAVVQPTARALLLLALGRVVLRALDGLLASSPRHRLLVFTLFRGAFLLLLTTPIHVNTYY